MSKTKKVCRACLLETSDTRSLFATGTILGETAKLVDVMLSCADLNIAKGDGLPQQICMQCIHQVSRAFSFKRQCEKSQQLLLDQLQNPRLQPLADTKSSLTEEKIILDNSDDPDSPEIQYIEDTVAIKCDENVDTSAVAENTMALNKPETITPEVKRVLKVRTARNAHKCKICGIAFNVLSNLKLHCFKEHSLPKPKYQKCDMCDKLCRSEEQLKRHINVHKTGKPFHCEQCDKSFCQRAAFVAHTYSHTGERPYLCTECGKAFKQNSELKIHMRMHLDLRPYSCEICGKAYRNSSLFSIHKRVHSGERPFPCTYCDKRFISSSCLKNHIMIHTGEKPYTCDYCGRSFNRSNALNIHRKIHTGERPHVCTVCGKGFIQAHCLQSHMNTHKTA